MKRYIVEIENCCYEVTAVSREDALQQAEEMFQLEECGEVDDIDLY
jgi:hypothetical protein